MHYEGHAFNEAFEKGKASGRLSTSREGISFRNDQAEVTLPLHGINLELGGAGNRIIFITNPSVPDWKLYTTDQTILKDPVLSGNISSQMQLKGVKNRKNLGKLIGIVILAAILCGGWCLWLLKDGLVVTITEQIPVEWETSLGDSAFDQMAGTKNIIKDEQLQKELELLVEPLLKVADNGRYKFRFHIIEDPTLNAAAFPGGNVIIHTGLINTLEKPEDLLGVLAHEIAHVNRRHSMQRLVNMAGMYIILSAVIGDIGAISGVILNGGSKLLQLQNSRHHERDADEIGWDYLVEANINPRGLINSFKKMKESMPEDNALADAEFLYTHPLLGNRIDYLEEKWSKLEKKEGFVTIDINYADFQARLKKHLLEKKPAKDESATTESKDEGKIEEGTTKEQ